MRRATPMLVAALAVAALSGCGYAERNAAALDMTTIESCSDQRPEYDFETDYVPPIDNPRLYGVAVVTSGFTSTYDFSVRVDVYTLDGEQVGKMIGRESNIEPGETRRVEIGGDMQIAMPPEGIDCRIRVVVVETI
jgi:hypothetical protein